MKRLLRVASGDPLRLSALLAERLSLPLEEAQALVRKGAIEVDGRHLRADVMLTVGARIVAFVADEETKAQPSAKLLVAYKDEHVFVIDKPAGLRSQAVRGDAWVTLIARVQRELDKHATLLHRLDRDTSGLVLLPRTDEARAFCQRALDAGQIDRRYLARVKGRLDAPRTVRLRIAPDPRDPRRRIAHPEAATVGDAAETKIEPIAPGDTESRVRLVLSTGRTHQLRVHLAAIGHPILGDTLYDGPPSDRLWLHADELSFPDVRTGALRKIVSALEALPSSDAAR